VLFREVQEVILKSNCLAQTLVALEVKWGDFLRGQSGAVFVPTLYFFESGDISHDCEVSQG